MQAGRGRKSTIKADDAPLIAAIKYQIALNPQNLDAVASLVEQQWGGTQQRTDKAFYKRKLGYRWQRFRKCLKKCQNPQEYQQAVKQLCELLYLQEQGYLQLYYGDETGFCLDPCIPYGWQPAAEYVSITPEKSKRLNVFGLLSAKNQLQAYSSAGTLNADLIMAFLDDFAGQIIQKTVVVLDNATIHHSEALADKIPQWAEQDLHIFYLPAYSPHLNLIETLWRKIKY